MSGLQLLGAVIADTLGNGSVTKYKLTKFIYMRITIALLAAVFTLIFSDMSFGFEQTRLVVGGTGSSLGFMRLLGRHFTKLYPKISVEVIPSLGTGGGIRALKNGAIDISVAGRILSENEKSGLQYSFLGTSPFVFAVHPETPLENINLSEIIDIYNGTLSTWHDGSRIRVFLRPVNDADWKIMKSFSIELSRALKQAQKNEGIHLSVTDNDALTYLENVRGSFGPATLTMILAEKRKVKILAFNDIRPGVANGAQKGYPLLKPYFVLSRTNATPAATKFIDFVHSDQGQKILSQVAIITDKTNLK
jgi:phosphate transport system substrate-binding protein